MDPCAYAYLLGIYLGDGHIVRCGRTQRLRIFCDLQHANVWWEIAGTVDWVGRRRPSLGLRPPTGLLIVSAYWNHWPCLFPQHGVGKKHERPIVLEPWQEEIVDAHPERFVRGLIHSDGCRSRNTIRHPKRTYVYPRYEFTNYSDDIRGLFCAACDRLGVPWTRMNRSTISVARREAVATLDGFIGPKT